MIADFIPALFKEQNRQTPIELGTRRLSEGVDLTTKIWYNTLNKKEQKRGEFPLNPLLTGKYPMLPAEQRVISNLLISGASSDLDMAKKLLNHMSVLYAIRTLLNVLYSSESTVGEYELLRFLDYLEENKNKI